MLNSTKIRLTVILGGLLLGIAIGFQNCAPAKFSFTGNGGIGTDGANNNLGDSGGGVGGSTGNPGGGSGTSGGGTGDDSCPKPPCDVDYPTKKGVGTAVWEDLFPNPIDADYNDFVLNFKINEKYSAVGLEEITIDFIPKARGAGYDLSLIHI